VDEDARLLHCIFLGICLRYKFVAHVDFWSGCHYFAACFYFLLYLFTIINFLFLFLPKLIATFHTESGPSVVTMCCACIGSHV
jgi:hypothetical protein